MAAQNSMSIERKLGCLWITLPDAITMYNSHDLEKAIIGNLENNGRVVFDFSRTRNLFSSGLGLLIRIRKTVGERDGVLCLVNVSAKLRDMLTALNLNKVFPIYATDVEFEISREDIWTERTNERKLGFLFVAQVENKKYRINISGEMVKGSNLSMCETFTPSPVIAVYIFDLSGLEAIDETGAGALLKLTKMIADRGGQCRAFGVEEVMMEKINLYGAEMHLEFFDDEKAAIEMLK
jgi:anti-anti-sigma factor